MPSRTEPTHSLLTPFSSPHLIIHSHSRSGDSTHLTVLAQRLAQTRRLCLHFRELRLQAGPSAASLRLVVDRHVANSRAATFGVSFELGAADHFVGLLVLNLFERHLADGGGSSG